ncbi:hypothetical protein Hypma_008342 [Hypsizygus marmoreus]|uniref:Uncharacterized protein n=1 Tax=Hypsizygus marmoreus TaxID=39966 RepID=A0A369JYQ5_HYPMA|nr:hypothetical protein Hypma_008342 [Hypsizygus marmoreus]
MEFFHNNDITKKSFGTQSKYTTPSLPLHPTSILLTLHPTPSYAAPYASLVPTLHPTSLLPTLHPTPSHPAPYVPSPHPAPYSTNFPTLVAP